MRLSTLALIITLILIGKLLCKFVFKKNDSIFNNAVIYNITQKDKNKSTVTLQPVKDIPDFMVSYDIASSELKNYKIGDTVRLEITASNGKAYIGDSLNNYLLFMRENIIDIIYYILVTIVAVMIVLGF